MYDVFSILIFTLFYLIFRYVDLNTFEAFKYVTMFYNNVLNVYFLIREMLGR